MRHVYGPAAGPVALLLPGTASTAEFLGRAFGPALAAFGIGLVCPPTGPPDQQFRALAEAAERFHPVLVGGVSLGAHLAARWAASAPAHRPDGLLLAMPAWTGAPEAIAAVSAAAADEVDRVGVTAALAGIRRRARDVPAAAWVADELAAAWPSFGPGLAATLRASAATAGPTLAELARVPVPCGVLALEDDPLHPTTVARAWTDALPRAALVRTHLAAVGADRGTLGRGALLAWLRARFGTH